MIRFDPSGLKGAFDRMAKTAKDKGKDMAGDQAKIFLSMTKKESWKEAPDVGEINKLLLLGPRLLIGTGAKKTNKGVWTIEKAQKEIDRRIRARGTFARNWKITRTESRGFSIRIYIENEVKYAALINERGASHRAAKKTYTKFKSKLDRLAKQSTGAFK